MATTKKYAGLDALKAFLDNIKNIFAPISHKHALSEISDYVVDTTLSSTSNNPVANSVLDAEFEAVGQAMNALEEFVDSYDDKITSGDSSTLQAAQTYADNAVAQKSQVQIITWEDDD